MRHKLQTFQSQIHTLACALLAVVFTPGCAEDHAGHEGDGACGMHGELHGDHCHCDAGYTPSADGLDCVVAQQTTSPGSPGNSADDNGGGGGTVPSVSEDGVLSFAPTETRAATETAPDGGQVWLMTGAQGTTFLNVELFESVRAELGSPGVVALEERDEDYGTCAVCVVLQTGCAMSFGSVSCERTYMARAGGELELESVGMSVGERLRGAFRSLVLQEVQIASDYRTQPVEGGDVLTLESWAFDVELESTQGGGGGELCSGHGQWHGDHCDCDIGYRPDPTDPTQCIPQ